MILGNFSVLTETEINEHIEAIEAERLRLGWSVPQASDFLHEHFGKRSRWLLTDTQLVLALELFKKATPDIDKYFPPCGACAFCGNPDARHRIFDTIKERLSAGDILLDIAEDYEVPVSVIQGIEVMA